MKKWRIYGWILVTVDVEAESDGEAYDKARRLLGNMEGDIAAGIEFCEVAIESVDELGEGGENGE